MYRYLAKQFPSPPQLFLVHPFQLSRWLEVAWAAAPKVPLIGGSPANEQLGSTTVIADFDLPELLLETLEPGIDLAHPGDWVTPGDRHTAPLLWDHLIYAYLIESTGVYEIISEIVSRMVRGDTLGRLSPETLQWARAMEELLFRDPPPFSIGSVISRLRSDPRIERRRAYYSFFGFDLPFPLPASPVLADGGQPPWKLDVGGANITFQQRLTELFGQIWTGYENRLNQVGANATDAQYVGLLCQTIDDMLGNRRQDGRMAREEMTYVAAMSLCHLTVEYDTPVVQDLQATATSPEERLYKMGAKVGKVPAIRSRELFELAEPMSALLWGIELGIFNPGAAPESLYLPNTLGGPPTQLNIEVNRIIDLWQSATGTRVKGPSVSVGGPAGTKLPAQPLRTPAPVPDSARAPVAAAPARGPMVPSSSNGQHV
jgi:hypothetical protein